MTPAERAKSLAAKLKQRIELVHISKKHPELSKIYTVEMTIKEAKEVIAVLESSSESLTGRAGNEGSGSAPKSVSPPLSPRPDSGLMGLKKAVEAIPGYWVGSGESQGNAIEATDGRFVKRSDVIALIEEREQAAKRAEREKARLKRDDVRGMSGDKVKCRRASEHPFPFNEIKGQRGKSCGYCGRVYGTDTQKQQ